MLPPEPPPSIPNSDLLEDVLGLMVIWLFTTLSVELAEPYTVIPRIDSPTSFALNAVMRLRAIVVVLGFQLPTDSMPIML